MKPNSATFTTSPGYMPVPYQYASHSLIATPVSGNYTVYYTTEFPTNYNFAALTSWVPVSNMQNVTENKARILGPITALKVEFTGPSIKLSEVPSVYAAVDNNLTLDNVPSGSILINDDFQLGAATGLTFENDTLSVENMEISNDLTVNNLIIDGSIIGLPSAAFASVAAMKLADLTSGEVVNTISYHGTTPPFATNTVGSAKYVIMSLAVFGGTPDGFGDHLLDNGLIAVLDKTEFVLDQYGAKGDGVTNDTDPCIALGNAVTAADGGTVTMRNVVYLVGKQDFAGASGLGYAYRGYNIFSFVNCTKAVVVNANGAKFIYPNGYKYGSFDPVTGLPFSPTLPFTNQNYAASMGVCFNFTGNSIVILQGGLEVDGNNLNLVLGGQWGDTGYQLSHNGFNFRNNASVSATDIYCHHMALDGGYIRDDNTTDLTTKRPHTLVNVRMEYNGRQGFSWTGGNSVTAINCKFNHTGKGGVNSSPAAGMDIEPTGVNTNRNGLFINSEFLNNNGVGMVADSGDSANVVFQGCKFQGDTNWAIWPRKPYFSFVDCLIVGRFVNSYTGSLSDGSATKYVRCIFTDEAIYGTVEGVGILGANLSSSSSLTGVLFDSCTITTTRMRAGRFDNAKLVNTTFNCNSGTTQISNNDYYLNLSNAEVENITINENITTSQPTTAFYVLTTNVKTRGRNLINSLSGANKLQWSSPTGGIGLYGEFNNSERANQYLSIIKGKGFGNGVGFYGDQRIFSSATIPTSGTIYQVGDWCLDPAATIDTSGNKRFGWLCTQITPSFIWTEMYITTARINLTGSATYDPPSIATLTSVTTTVTVTGAVVGQTASASFSVNLGGIMLDAQVTAANTVTVRFFNTTAAAVDLASGTLKVTVTG